MSLSQEFDEYGFLILPREETVGSTVLDDSDRCHQYSPQPSEDVVEKWETALDSWDQSSKSSQQVRLLFRKGLPRSLRSRAWQLFLETHTLKSQSTFKYQTALCKLQTQLNDLGLSEYSTEGDIRALNGLLGDSARAEGSSDESVTKNEWLRTVRQIMMDIGRSFPCHRLFMGEDAGGKKGLLHLLALYAMYNPTVGYCQGMAYIGGMLLMTIEGEEEEAFWALVSLFERQKYLSGYYSASMTRLQTHADVFALMLKEKLPDLASHFDSLGVHPLLYLTPWFMCLYTSLSCWDTVLAVCDLVFLEGINTVFRVALAILNVSAPEMMVMYRIEQLLPFLQHLPTRLVSQGVLLPVVHRTVLNQWEVEHYLDTVHREKEQQDRGSCKRSAPCEEEGVDSPRSAKRRRKNPQTPAPSSKASLFTRIKNVFTPARQYSTPYVTRLHPQAKHTTQTELPARRNLTSVNRSSRKRKRQQEGDENCDLNFSIQAQDIELTDFTVNTPKGKLFGDSPLNGTTPLIGGASPQLTSVLSRDKGPRRSVRIAKRRSVCQQTASPLLPSTSILSPVSVQPLQDHVQTSSHLRERHAFKMFTTPTLARAQACPLTPDINSPLLLRTPEVELKTLNNPMCS